MFINWFNATEAKKFGEEMAALIEHRSRGANEKLSPTAIAKADKRHQITLNLVEKRVEVFKKNHKLNIYTKAQLGSSFKYALLDRGYDPEFCNATTTWLLIKCK